MINREIGLVEIKGSASISSLVSEAIKDLRIAGNEFVLSCERDKSKPAKRKQTEFAEMIGVKSSFYSQLENGSAAFNIAQINQICDGVGMSLGGLFNYVEYMKQNLKNTGISVVSEKLPLHLDVVRKENKEEEKKTAMINKWTRESKKAGTYRLLSKEEIEEQHRALEKAATDWFKRNYESDEMQGYFQSAAFHGEEDGDLDQ